MLLYVPFMNGTVGKEPMYLDELGTNMTVGTVVRMNYPLMKGPFV